MTPVPIAPPTFWATITAAVLRKRCGWCRQTMDGGGPIGPYEDVTDGICPACAARFLQGVR